MATSNSNMLQKAYKTQASPGEGSPTGKDKARGKGGVWVRQTKD